MKITFQNAVEDVVDLTIYRLDKAGQTRLSRNIFQFLLPIVSIGYLLWDSAQSGQPISFTSPILAVAALWLFLSPLILRRLLRQRLLTHLKTQSASNFDKMRTVEIQEPCLLETIEGKEHRYPWAEIDRLEVIGSSVALMMENNKAIIIPRRAFGSIKDMAQFVQALKAKIYIIEDDDGDAQSA